MKNLKITLLLIVLVAFLSQTYADYSIDQLDHSWQFWSSNYPTPAGQSFTTFGSGSITHIEIWKRTDFSTELKIYQGQSLDPLDEIYSQMVTTSGGPGSEIIELTTPLSVNEFSTYTFAFVEGSDENGSYLNGGGDLYPGGQAYLGFWWTTSDFYFVITFESSFIIPHQWTGTVNTDWSNPSNWNDNTVPAADADVIIGDGFTNYPVLVEAVTVNSINLKGSGSLTLQTDASLNILADLFIGNGQGGSFVMNGGVCNINGIMYSRSNSATTITGGNLEFGSWFEGSSFWEFPKGDITLSGGDILANENLKFYYGLNGIMDGSFNLTVNGDYGSVEEYWTVTDGTVTLTGAAGEGPFQCYSNSVYSYNTFVAYNLNVNAPGKEFYLCNENGSTDMHIVNDLNIQAGHLKSINNLMTDTSGYVTVGGDIIIGTEGSFSAIVTDAIDIAGDYSIQSSSTATGSWLDNDKLNVSGNSLVERYISEDAWHYISSPVSGAISIIFLDIYLRNWDESTYSWNPYITSLTEPLTPGMGFAVWSMGSTTGNTIIQYTGGQVNGGDVTLPVSATDANSNFAIGDGEGWNFVGNPYPSAINWNENWTSVNISPTAYFWDGSLGSSGNYSTWNYFTGTGVNKDDGTIPPGQGFYVKATDFNPILIAPQSERFHDNHSFLKKASGEIERDGITNLVIQGKPVIFDAKQNSLMIQTENDKIDIDAILNTEEFKTQNSKDVADYDVKTSNTISDFEILKMRVEGNQLFDESIILFSELASAGFNPLFDAYKIKGSADAPQLYILASESEYAVKAFPESNEEMVIPLAFEAGITDEYQIYFEGMDNFDGQVFLEDLKDNLMVNLEETGQYQFMADPKDEPLRFLLHFSDHTTGTTSEFDNKENDQLYAYANEIYINMKNEESGKVIVYNLLGEEIAYNDRLSLGLNKLKLQNVHGFVIVRLFTGSDVITKKLYISE